MEIESLPRKSARMLAMPYLIQWLLKLPRKFSPKLRSRGLYIHMKPLRNIGKVCGAGKQSGLYRLQGDARAFSP
jgi:hypothetical protein